VTGKCRRHIYIGPVEPRDEDGGGGRGGRFEVAKNCTFGHHHHVAYLGRASRARDAARQGAPLFSLCWRHDEKVHGRNAPWNPSIGTNAGRQARQAVRFEGVRPSAQGYHPSGQDLQCTSYFCSQSQPTTRQKRQIKTSALHVSVCPTEENQLWGRLKRAEDASI